MVALGCTGVGAEKVQLGAVGQDDRVALELDPNNVAGEGLDIGLEDVRLGL
ncbi:hypothetical protein D3C78_1913530 [compost metagenome]